MFKTIEAQQKILFCLQGRLSSSFYDIHIHCCISYVFAVISLIKALKNKVIRGNTGGI